MSNDLHAQKTEGQCREIWVKLHIHVQLLGGFCLKLKKRGFLTSNNQPNFAPFEHIHHGT